MAEERKSELDPAIAGAHRRPWVAVLGPREWADGDRPGAPAGRTRKLCLSSSKLHVYLYVVVLPVLAIEIALHSLLDAVGDLGVAAC